MASFELHDVALGYAGLAAVRHLNGAVASGSLTAIVGPNGSGKSTILKGLAGLLNPLSGHIERCDIAHHQIAYLPQTGELDLNFPSTVFDLVSMGLWKKRGAFAGYNTADQTSVSAALERVGLRDFTREQINGLSGGQLQRALFARLIVQDAPVILLDEPFSAIDENTTEDLMALIMEWHNQGRTIMAVLHDFEFVKMHFPQTLLLAKRPFAWGATSEVLHSTSLANMTRIMHERIDAR